MDPEVPGSSPEWVPIFYEARSTAQGLPKPSSLRGSTVGYQSCRTSRQRLGVNRIDSCNFDTTCSQGRLWKLQIQRYSRMGWAAMSHKMPGCHLANAWRSRIETHPSVAVSQWSISSTNQLSPTTPDPVQTNLGSLEFHSRQLYSSNLKSVELRIIIIRVYSLSISSGWNMTIIRSGGSPKPK